MNDRDIIQAFANKHKLIFEDEGECGFGRECVGLTNGSNWVDYNPISEALGYDYIPEFYDERLEPPEGVTDAYHKHKCMAVLGRGERAIHQLALWCQRYDELGVERVDRENESDSVFQLMMCGTHIPTWRVKAD